jgi:hypothetical protein
VIRPRVVPYPAVDGLVGIACAFGAKLPDGPAIAVFRVEECDELIERVPIRALREGLRRTGTVYDGVRFGASHWLVSKGRGLALR